MDNYIFEFNSTVIPPNFKNFIKLDLKKVFEQKKNLKSNVTDLSKDSNLLYLNQYKSVFIEKKIDTNIEFKLGGTDIIINSKYIHFLFFPKYHDCCIKINSIEDFNIYILSSINDLEEIKILKKIISNYAFYFNENINLLPQYDSNYKNTALIIRGGMIGIYNIFEKNKKNDENKFYYELEKDEINSNTYNELEFQKKIHILDNYIQNDILKIYKMN